MKIQPVITKNGSKRINVVYNSYRVGAKHKQFKWGDFQKACDFAVNIYDDKYIDTCPNELLDWMKDNDHPILRKKYFDFC